MTDRRDNEAREVRDEETGRFLGRLNPRTMEFTRPDRGRTLRAKLTDYLPATKSAAGESRES